MVGLGENRYTKLPSASRQPRAMLLRRAFARAPRAAGLSLSTRQLGSLSVAASRRPRAAYPSLLLLRHGAAAPARAVCSSVHAAFDADLEADQRARHDDEDRVVVPGGMAAAGLSEAVHLLLGEDLHQ